MKFRQGYTGDMDRVHYFGSMGLSFVLTLVYATWLSYTFEAPTWNYWVLGYVLGFVTSFIAGLVFEFLEAKIFHSYRDVNYWKAKPAWLKQYFSGDKWDSQDISYNFLGATIIHPVVMLILDFKKEKEL